MFELTLWPWFYCWVRSNPKKDLFYLKITGRLRWLLMEIRAAWDSHLLRYFCHLHTKLLSDSDTNGLLLFLLKSTNTVSYSAPPTNRIVGLISLFKQCCQIPLPQMSSLTNPPAMIRQNVNILCTLYYQYFHTWSAHTVSDVIKKRCH